MFPPRWNQWSRRQDHSTSSRPTQVWRVRGSVQEPRPAQASSPPRRDAHMQRRQEEGLPPTAARQAAPGILPTPPIPPRAQHPPTDNQRKRERETSEEPLCTIPRTRGFGAEAYTSTRSS
jgi:hypothetical protein